MSSPELASRPARASGLSATATTRAMATSIQIGVARVGARDGGDGGDGGVEAALREALEVFHRVERACTRFQPDSPLMRANASPDRFHAVPPELYEAIRAAARAYGRTRGGFDPRVLEDLTALGYDRTLPFGHEPVRLAGSGRLSHRRSPRGPWCPQFRGATREVRIGPVPIDLGGLGKGLAVDWAARRLEAAGFPHHLVEAGGDCRLGGRPDDAEEWNVALEDPLGGPPVAVLAVRGRAACATSSSRLRSWEVAGRRVHHLIDPATGLPGGAGLASVSVVGPEASSAEVWSKTLLLAGAGRVARLAAQRSLACCWVADDGAVGMSRAMERHVVWTR